MLSKRELETIIEKAGEMCPKEISFQTHYNRKMEENGLVSRERLETHYKRNRSEMMRE